MIMLCLEMITDINTSLDLAKFDGVKRACQGFHKAGVKRVHTFRDLQSFDRDTKWGQR